MKAFFALPLLAALALPGAARFPAAPTGTAEPRPLTPVVIDAGHGGDDLGAVAGKVREKDLALTFALKLRKRLARSGDLPVLLTREDDRFVPLDHRVVDSVDWTGGVFVSLHLNQTRSRRNKGVVVYSYGPEKLKPWRKRRMHPSVPPMPAPPRGQAAESERLARLLTRSLDADGFQVERQRSDYYVLKNPAEPSVLVELGYLSNADEAGRLVDAGYQDKLVESLARAIEEYASRRSLGNAVTAVAPKP